MNGDYQPVERAAVSHANNSEAVSDERLAKLVPQLTENIRLMEHRLAKSAIPEESWETAPALADARLKLALVTELLSRRSLDSADGVEAAAGAFVFDRYVNGQLMAEGVAVEQQATLQGAMQVAARIAAKGPKGETPVLVLASRPACTAEVVKALLWEEDEPGWWCAQPTAMIGGFGYEVRVTDSGKVRARHGREDWAAFDGTLAEAKAAAQADFDQRIRSALAPPSPAQSAIVPPVVEVTEAMVDRALTAYVEADIHADCRTALRSALLAALQAQHRGE
jgi:hypothetical protein